MEASISPLRSFVFVLAASLGLGVAPAEAQSSEESRGHSWTLDRLHQGFCVQFLVDPAEVAKLLPAGARPLPAGRAEDLHASLRTVVTTQREFATWAPARLCLFYFGRIQAEGVRLQQDDPRKAPMLALWTVAAETGGGARRDVALEVFANSPRLERPGQLAGLDVRRVRTSVGPMPEDEEGRPSPDDRYTVRVGKTTLQWDGRVADDSAPPPGPLVTTWQAAGRRGWVPGTLRLTPRMAAGMIGSLKVQGKGDLADMLMSSPTRFVGPAYVGGGGTLTLGR